MRVIPFVLAVVVGSSVGVAAPPATVESRFRQAGRSIATVLGLTPPFHASFDYGGVSRAHTGLGEVLPKQLQLEHDQEWTVAIWFRNPALTRVSPVACMFWGNNALSPEQGHILGLFAYFDEEHSPDHGNLIAWVHGLPYRVTNPDAPLDDDAWHLVAVRNREYSGVFKVALSYDGGAWEGEAPAPITGIADATLPWSTNSMYDDRWPVPWVRRRNCKLDELVVFDWALDWKEIKKLHNNGRARLPDGGKGLYSQLESSGESIAFHLMFGGDGASTTTTHKSFTDLNDPSLEFDVEGAGAGVIDETDYPGV